MKLLVTGGSGRVGKFVVAGLRDSYEITVFDRREPHSKDVRFIKGDVTILRYVEEAARGIDAIIHLAAIPVPLPGQPDKVMKVNVMGTLNVLEAAVRNNVKRVMFASSDAVLGIIFAERDLAPEYLPVDESHPLRPQDSYGLSKLIGEEICKSYSRKHGISTICLRYCFVWYPETYEGYSAIAKSPMNPKRLWAYTDVRDVVQAFGLALKARKLEHEAFFISAENTFSKTPSLELVKRYYPEGKVVSGRGRSPIQGNSSLFSIEKARTLLGYAPEYGWEDLV